MANPWENDQIVEAPKAADAKAPWEQDALVDEPSTFSQSGAGIAHSLNIGMGNTARGVGQFLQAPGENLVSAGVNVGAAASELGANGQPEVDPMGNPTGQQQPMDAATAGRLQQDASEARRNAQTAADMAQEARQRNVASGAPLATAGDILEQGGKSVMQANQEAMARESPMMVRQQQAIQDANGFWPTVGAMASNPLGTLGTTAQSLPDMAIGMGVARGVGAVSRLAAESTARAAGEKAFQETLIKAASNPETLASASKLASDARAAAYHQVIEHATDQTAGAAALGTESLQSGWQTSSQVVDALQQRRPDGTYALSNDDLTKQSPRFRELVSSGVDPDQARRYLQAELSDATAPLAALWTGLAGKASGAAVAEARVAMGRKLTAGQVARNIGKETLEETLQNPGENYAQYLGQAGYDPNASYDFGGSVAQGVVGGGLLGAAMHGGGHAVSGSPPTERLAGRPIDSYSTDDLAKFVKSGVLTADVKERVDAELARRTAETQLPASETPGQAGQGEALDAEVQRFAEGSGISPDGAAGVGAGSALAGRSAGDLGTDLRNADGNGGDAAGSPAGSRLQAQPAAVGLAQQSGALNGAIPQAVDLRQQALDRAQPAQAPVEQSTAPEEQANAPAAANRPAGPLDQMAATSVVLNRSGARPVFTTDDRSTASGVSHLGSERARNIAGLAVGQQSIRAWSSKNGIASEQAPSLQQPPPEVERAAYAVADAIHQATGNRPVLFHDPRAGAVDGFAINGQSYINTANLEQSIHFTAFHEAWHVAEQRAGQGDVAAQQFVKIGHTIFDMISDEGKRAYAQKVLFAHQLGDGGSMTIDEALAHPQLRSEMVADFFGKRAEDIRFLNSLAQRAPLSFGGFVRSWIDSISGIIDRFKASRALGSRDVDPYIRKLSHAKAVAASALIQWRRNNPSLASPAPHPGDFYRPQFSLRGLGRNEAAAAEKGGAANAPESDIGHRRMESGVYVGAPSWVGDSPQRLAALRQRLYKLAIEGKTARHWYEESSRAILELANGDKQEAAKIVGLLAIYSPNATVPANTSMALTAYFQYKAGLPIKAGLGMNNTKAEALLREGKWWSGIKTNSFFQNLMSEIEPSSLDPNVATMDMWMALAFDYGKKKIDQGPTYRFMEREIAHLGQQLGWPARQVQSAVWSAIKGRVETTEGPRKAYELERGIASRVAKRSPNGKLSMVHLVARGMEHAHFRTATRFGMERGPLTRDELSSAAYSFATALKERTVQMSWEATPGAASGVLPGLLKAPIKYQFQYLVDVERALLDENGHDAVARAVGLPGGVSINGISAWEGNVGAGAQTFVAAPFTGSGSAKKDLKPEAYKLLDAYAAARGLILNQEAVVYHAPVFEAAKKDHNGLDVHASRPLTEDEVKTFYNLAYDAFGTWEIAPAYQPQGLRVLNFKEGLDNERFQDGLEHVLAQLPDGWGGGITDARRFKSVGNYVSNNWQEQPNGEGYRAALSAVSPDLQERVAGLQARVAAVNQRYSRKYGWGPATRADVQASGEPSFSARQGGAGTPAEASGRSGAQARLPAGVDVTGTHFSQSERSALDGRRYGSGLRGAEGRRIANAADPRLRERVYFYVDEGAGIRPESGVGAVAHRIDAKNLYNMAANPLRLSAADANAMESKILDAGYSGYYIPKVFNNQGVGVLLGPASRNVPATALPRGATSAGENVAVAVPAAPAARAEGRELVLRPKTATEQLHLVKARDFIKSIAPSFHFQYGEARVQAHEAAAADAAIALQGGTSKFSPAIEKSIVNPISPSATVHEKVDQLNGLTKANRTLVHAYLRRIDQALGTESKDSVKDPEKIEEKASRPMIRAAKPWHDVEHIRDSYRMKTVVSDITKLPLIVEQMRRMGAEIVKPDLAKVLNPGPYGWRIAVFDLRMPNGQLVEHYMTFKELEQAKKDGGHQIFESVRNLDPTVGRNSAIIEEAQDRSRAHYQKAFDDYLARTGQSLDEIRASLTSALRLAAEGSDQPSAKSPALTPLGAGDHLPSAERTAENPSSKTAATEGSSSETYTSAMPAFSRRQAPKANPSIDVPPAENRKQAVQRTLQDKFNRMRIIQEWAKKNGAKLTPAADVYTTEERMYGRISTRTQDFREKTVKPLVQAVQKAGYTMEQVAEVLHAMHAEERNARSPRSTRRCPTAAAA
jgi:hypothetical protein